MDEYLTTTEIASLLKINVMTVRRWIGQGRITATNLGKEYRVKKADLDSFLSERELRKGGNGK